jgi:heme exporter protein CcmD
MTETISHLPFIVGSYAAAGIVISGLVAWVMFDYRAQRRALADLQKRGVVRRSTVVRPQRTMAKAEEKA